MIAYTVEILPNKTWQYDWDDTGTYDIVLQGRVITTITGTSYVYDLPWSGSPPPLEIVPQDTLIIDKPYACIQWYRDSTADHYEVQEYIVGAWVTRFQMKESGAPVYTFRSKVLETETTHTYRVVSYNILRDMSVGLSITIKIVAPPKCTALSVTHVNGKVLIGA